MQPVGPLGADAAAVMDVSSPEGRRGAGPVSYSFTVNVYIPT